MVTFSLTESEATFYIPTWIFKALQSENLETSNTVRSELNVLHVKKKKERKKGHNHHRNISKKLIN